MKHEIEKSNKDFTKCSCGEYFVPEFATEDKYFRFLDHKKRAEASDSAKERLKKRDRSELLKKWSGKIGYISGTTGHQCSGIPIWERKIGNYFVLCYFFERTFGGGVPAGEVFGVIEEMPDGSLKPIVLDIQIDIIFKGVVRKIEIKEKKLIISYEKNSYCGKSKIERVMFDLTEKHHILHF